MNRSIAVGAFVAVALLVGGVIAADDVKSGPQVGKARGGPFNPLNVTNVDKPGNVGKKNCFV
jgi:hypothetical protein